MSSVSRIGVLVALFLAFGCAASSPEEAPSESRQVQAIVRSTASPFCPGKTLDSCPSPSAGEWRRDIHRWIADGVPETEIRARLQERTPEFDLEVPPVKWGWVIPTSATCVSTLWFALMVRRFRRRRQASGRDGDRAGSQECSDDRLDRELALYRVRDHC